MKREIQRQVSRYIAESLKSLGGDIVSALHPAPTSPWESITSYLGVVGIAVLIFFTLLRFAKPAKGLSTWRVLFQSLVSVGTGIAFIWIAFCILPYDTLMSVSWIAFFVGALYPIILRICREPQQSTALVFRPHTGIPITCPGCGIEMRVYAANCVHTHNAPPPSALPLVQHTGPVIEMTQCSNCHNNVPNRSFCGKCGEPLGISLADIDCN